MPQSGKEWSRKSTSSPRKIEEAINKSMEEEDKWEKLLTHTSVQASASRGRYLRLYF